MHKTYQNMGPKSIMNFTI